MVSLTSRGKLPIELEISGLRGLALLMVVCGHFVQRVDRFNSTADGYAPAGQVVTEYLTSPASGVYLFFAISGYLIARILNNFASLKPVNLIDFFLRRFLRIALPYSVVLLVTWVTIISTRIEPPSINHFDVRPNSLGESLLASLTYMHGLLYGTFPRLFPPGWTLEVEMQFYLLAPLLFLAFRLTVARLGLGWASAAAMGSSGLVSLAAIQSGIANLRATIFVYVPLFVLGFVIERVKRSGWRPTSAVTAALGWPALIIFMFFEPWVWGQGQEIAIRMVLIAAMFAALASGRGSFLSACASPLLVSIGLLSYAGYLVHLQILHLTAAVIAHAFGPMPLAGALLINALVGLPLVLLAAFFFFTVVEKPSLRLRLHVLTFDRPNAARR